MSEQQCDVCGDTVPIPGEFDDHNLRNYVRHVFLSHPDDEQRIQIIQSYIDRQQTRRGPT